MIEAYAYRFAKIAYTLPAAGNKCAMTQSLALTECVVRQTFDAIRLLMLRVVDDDADRRGP